MGVNTKVGIAQLAIIDESSTPRDLGILLRNFAVQMTKVVDPLDMGTQDKLQKLITMLDVDFDLID